MRRGGYAAEFTRRERAAIHFAEKMALDHHNIGDDNAAAIRRHSATPGS